MNELRNPPITGKILHHEKGNEEPALDVSVSMTSHGESLRHSIPTLHNCLPSLTFTP